MKENRIQQVVEIEEQAKEIHDKKVCDILFPLGSMTCLLVDQF